MTLVMVGHTARKALRYPLAEELALIADAFELRAYASSERRAHRDLERASLMIRRFAKALDKEVGRAKNEPFRARALRAG